MTITKTYKTRVNVSMDTDLLRDIDQRVAAGEFANRSEAIEWLLTASDDDEPYPEPEPDDDDDDQADDDD